MTFSQALEELKNGKRLSRKNWNGKDQFIELVNQVSYINSLGNKVNVNHETAGNSVIAFNGTSGIQLGWLASQADLLSDDWYVKG